MKNLRYALLTFVMGCVPACNDSASPPKRPPTAVNFVYPVQNRITAWDEYTGRLEAVEDVELRARVSGLLESIHFEDGQLVRKGDLLFTIDPKPFQADLSAAEADLNQARAASHLAKVNLERGQDLLKRNAIAREGVDIREGDYAQAEARVEAAVARVAAARLSLGYTEVRAPIGGRASDRFVTEGNLISGGTAESTLLTTIVSVDPIFCRIEADESSVLKYMRLNQQGKRESARDTRIPVEMGLSDDKDYPRNGYIDFVNNSFDTATATLRARAVFPNEDGFLTPGMFARVRLPGRGEITATLVPEIAIQTQQDFTSLLTVDDGNLVKVTPVTLGPRHGRMRVIESELPLDTRVIVTGLTSIFPGTTVAPVEQRATPSSTAGNPPGKKDDRAKAPSGANGETSVPEAE